MDIGANGSCQVTRSSIGVNLGTVNKAEFKGKTTVAGAAQTFSIPVFCSTPADIRIGFFRRHRRSRHRRRFSPRPGRRRGRAGVGIKLSYGNNSAPAPSAGTPIKINEASNLPVLKTYHGEQRRHRREYQLQRPLRADGDRVTPGRANGLATFALEYN
nr:Fimbrial protein [Raoultella sp. NCTC 9187]